MKLTEQDKLELKFVITTAFKVFLIMSFFVLILIFLSL
jgi:hypothetical protein